MDNFGGFWPQWGVEKWGEVAGGGSGDNRRFFFVRFNRMFAYRIGMIHYHVKVDVIQRQGK